MVNPPKQQARHHSSVARYQRIAQLETVLAIRERQHQRNQTLILWFAVILVTALGSATVLGLL